MSNTRTVNIKHYDVEAKISKFGAKYSAYRSAETRTRFETVATPWIRAFRRSENYPRTGVAPFPFSRKYFQIKNRIDIRRRYRKNTHCVYALLRSCQAGNGARGKSRVGADNS